MRKNKADEGSVRGPLPRRWPKRSDWLEVIAANQGSLEDVRAAELATEILNSEENEAHRQRVLTRCRMYLRETGEWPGRGTVNRWAREEFQPVLDAIRRG